LIFVFEEYDPTGLGDGKGTGNTVPPAAKMKNFQCTGYSV
jgi:hypothetical protein